MSELSGRKKLVRDISANTLQSAIVQVFGLAVFYLTSRYLQKNDFGEFNWCMAVGSTAIAVFSLGLDLIFVKRVARGENVVTISAIHFFHTLTVGMVLCTAAFLIRLFVPGFTGSHPFFFFVILSLALANVGNSFKLCLNGLEAYRTLAVIALCANVLKLLLVVALYVLNRFTIVTVIYAYTATSLLELCLGYFFVSRQLSVRLRPLLKAAEYKYLILESLPQLGVVLFDSALARMDWILLGIMSTAAATAEYSFAYKVFELSKLPLLIIAPVLLTRFSKLFSPGGMLGSAHKNEIRFFFKLEMFVVMLIPIILVCTWGPLIDFFTDNKYGAVNEKNYAILALCVPLHGIINFLWTLGFVQGQLKTIFVITVIVSLLNIAANALLIPLYGTQGSALAFLACTLIQLLLYLKFINQSQITLSGLNIVISFLSALTAVIVSKSLINNVIFAAMAAVAIHTCITFITRQISMRELRQLALRNWPAPASEQP